MVNIYSPTGSEAPLVSFLVKWARNHGFESHVDSAGNFIAQKGTGADVLLVGHVDTVPGELPVRIEHNILYGRGAVDAKASLAAFLEAASSIIPCNRLVVVGVVDEEGSSRGAHHLLTEYNPASIIIGEPSGWDSLTLGYKGKFHITYEDTREKTHSSLENISCIEQAMVFVTTLRAWCNSYNEGKSMFYRLGMHVATFHSDTDGFSDAVLMTIIFRIPPGFQKNIFTSFIESRKGSAHLQYSSYEPPVKASKTNHLVSAFLRAIRSLNGKTTFKVKSGTSDMNILQAFRVPILAYGPGDSRYDHTPHEHISLIEFETSVAVLQKVLAGL